MLKRFDAAREDRPAEAWRARFEGGRAETERWYLGQGLAPPPSPAECRAALAGAMPELVPHYDQACALVGDDARAHQILSHYRPPRSSYGCSQAVWLGEGGPALVRNYDCALDTLSGRFELSSWSGRRVLCKAQRPWGGCLDGMNDDGLVASLTFGGDPSQGLGFSIILMLRYVLETCSRVDEAVSAMCRIPVALSQNVTLLDASGAYATLFLGPDRPPTVTQLRACTNHQASVLPATAARTQSIERQEILLKALGDPTLTLPDFVSAFLAPPLLSRRAASTTAYTAVYRPADGQVDYLWPGTTWRQSFDRFDPGEYTNDYGILDR